MRCSLEKSVWISVDLLQECCLNSSHSSAILYCKKIRISRKHPDFFSCQLKSYWGVLLVTYFINVWALLFTGVVVIVTSASASLAAFYGDSFTALLWPGPGPGGGAGTGNAGTSCRQRTADTQLPRSGPSCPGRGRPDVPGPGINDQCSTNWADLCCPDRLTFFPSVSIINS